MSQNTNSPLKGPESTPPRKGPESITRRVYTRVKKQNPNIFQAIGEMQEKEQKEQFERRLAAVTARVQALVFASSSPRPLVIAWSAPEPPVNCAGPSSHGHDPSNTETQRGAGASRHPPPC